MAYPEFTAGAVMNSAAALNNDPSRTIYTYAKQIPFVNIALRSLERAFELNDIPVTAVTSAVIPVDAEDVVLTFTAGLPADLVEPKILWERPRGVNPFVSMTRVDFLPQQLAGVEISSLQYWVWQSQQIEFLPASADNDVKMEYIRYLFSAVADETDDIGIINSQAYLEWKVAALVASKLAENPTRAGECELEAERALQENMGIGSKGRQGIITRHRPFRAGYKRRSA